MDYIYAKSDGKPTTEEKLTTTFKQNGKIESTREIIKFLKGFSDSDNLKDYILEGLSTYSADFKGTFTTQQAMNAVTGNKNDYCYLITQDAEGNNQYDRYTWVVGTGWVYTYTLKQDDFTDAEWAAIQSGITAELVEKLRGLEAQVQSDWDQSDSEEVDFIKNKPTIPASPVQSDWNESDSGSLAYIQNKPTIPTVPNNVSAFNNDAGYLNGADALREQNIAAILALAPGTETTTLTTSPEWKLVLVDHDDKILLGKRADNTWYTPMDLDELLDFVIADYGVNV